MQFCHASHISQEKYVSKDAKHCNMAPYHVTRQELAEKQTTLSHSVILTGFQPSFTRK
jgi:hypothetical protein